MQLVGKPKIKLRDDAKDFLNLYASLGERAENFLPNDILDKLTYFVRLCYEQPDDPAKQTAERDRMILELKEAIPGYTDVSLMLYPHEDSKAFQYRTQKLNFADKLTSLINTEAVDDQTKKQTLNILHSHDYSIGTPPVTQNLVDYLYKLLLGDSVMDLKKFRDVIGVNGDDEEAQWNYLLNVLDQMVIQSTHYTTAAEKKDFLEKSELTVNFKGLNGFIRTVVGGSAETAIRLLSEEVFAKYSVVEVDYTDADDLFEKIKLDYTKVFLVKIKYMRKNIFNQRRWFPFLTRIVLIDDSPESQSTNTSLVFAFHNAIISTLDKVHTKKLGSLANSQLNLRLILDKVNTQNIEKFRDCANAKIADYEQELADFKINQIQTTNEPLRDIVMFKFDDFAKQIIKDKYALTKLRDYFNLILSVISPEKRRITNLDLIHEFEERTRSYFYSGNKFLKIATIIEGGGRNQIKTYGDYLLQRPLKDIDEKILKRCHTILDIIPNNYQRTLNNHFHKNFGINLFLEKYKEYLTKAENEADNRGRFHNFLIDLGIKDAYDSRSVEEQDIIKGFISDLSNLDKTSISDDVQMIIRDILLHQDNVLRPYILYNVNLSWEYQDLFPGDRFDLNPFDLEIGNYDDGRIDFNRLLVRLQRMKATFQLFDDTGNLWDRFCANLTIVINDPANPSGYTDFNNEDLLSFLKFLTTSKITLFLDEAYNDSVKTSNKEEPKWRTISRYVMNNLSAFANISIVSSISTTKNLSGTGNRLGALIATPAKESVIKFAKERNTGERCNTNSVYMLVNIIEAAELAKKLKDKVEERLPQNASIHHFAKRITENIIDELSKYEQNQRAEKNPKKTITRYSPFEGSPLHIFLLEELVSLDKLAVLELPDDFMYKGKPFFRHYQEELVKSLNKFRVNKIFREEAYKRLTLLKQLATKLIAENKWEQYARVIDSDGSYLFNLQLHDFASYQGLEKFTKELAAQRGIALIPYKTGFVRFSVGGYLDGSAKSYEQFASEFTNAITLFFRYWTEYYQKRNSPAYKDFRTEDILDEMFKVKSDKEFIERLLADFNLIKNISKQKLDSLKISNIQTLYHAFPAVSGININSIGESKNAVFEFYENIGECKDVKTFIRSKAFTKIYENLLPQVYKNIPAIKHLDFNTVIAKYGKSTILKYIENKLTYKPNNYVLDAPDDLNTMKEILIEIENILFSDSKFKIMTLNASESTESDLQKLEGANMILKKYIKEIMIHFNLPFENEGTEPTIEELVATAAEKFEELTGKSTAEFGITTYTEAFIRSLRNSEQFKNVEFSDRQSGNILHVFSTKIYNSALSMTQKMLFFYLLKRENVFEKAFMARLNEYGKHIDAAADVEFKMILNGFIDKVIQFDLVQILDEIFEHRKFKVSLSKLHTESRAVSLMFIDIINRTKATEYYDKYTHSLSRFVETTYRKQNSSINEMIQHGITLYKDFEMQSDVLETYNGGSLKWIKDVMVKCGVICAEQPVQMHTRISTDAKKREYPFHKVDLTQAEIDLRQKRIEESKKKEEEAGKELPNEYIKNLATKPEASFFGKRMLKFIENMDENDYRCKIINKGLFKELVIFQKAYIKYLADNYRILGPDVIRLEEVQNFVPDVIQFLGAPEKVMSFPQIGYFDLEGPNGKIKTMVTPLKMKVDYFGDVKKPRLTMINEKVKEMGGVPVHGSLFAVEEEDGGLFVVEVDGDSGVGKSEMLAALMLKWLKKDMTRIRSIKLIAGDMFHVFPDKDGNLYGIGTEIGDFSRVTDFDPDYIKYYNSLFESSADSNVEDLNSRSTIGGLCDIAMPYKIDIMLTASNYSKEEAGVIRYDNPENFLYYRHSHGERKEKATSEDGPHFQRTFLRYTADPNIVQVLDKHGNYIDEILDWDFDTATNTHYLCSSYKLIGKIDLQDIVNQLFKDKEFARNGKQFIISNIEFDIIRNRFLVNAHSDNERIQFKLDRKFFGSLFNALASTPAGQPFVSEYGQAEGKKDLLNILKGNYAKGKDGKGKGRRIQLGVLSTDLGKNGREISGPQKAAEELKKLIQEVRIQNPEMNENKQKVRNIVHEKYQHIFNGTKFSPEIQRYNFLLWQLEQMRKAEFVRIDDMNKKVDLSKLKGFQPLAKNHLFSPLLVTPNINFELNSFTETYEQLMSLPNSIEFANEFLADCPALYVAKGYNTDTIENNMVIQLLLLNGYITIEDLNRGCITEKANRETLAAAMYAVKKFLNPEGKIVETNAIVSDEKTKSNSRKKK